MKSGRVKPDGSDGGGGPARSPLPKSSLAGRFQPPSALPPSVFIAGEPAISVSQPFRAAICKAQRSATPALASENNSVKSLSGIGLSSAVA